VTPTVKLHILTTAAMSLPAEAVAHGVAEALRSRGTSVSIVDGVADLQRDATFVIVAPHEVLPSIALEDRTLAETLQRSVIVSTVRPASGDWALSRHFAERAGAVLDISDAGVTAFASLGIKARRFRLGYDPSQDRSSGGIETRPLDVAFLGASTPRRLRIMAEAARHLSSRDVDLRFTEGVASRDRTVTDFLAGEDKYRLLASAKIVLNIHPDDDPLFEWMRAQSALSNGALYVSELSSGATPLDPGRHFVSVNHSHLGPTLDRLLDEPERLEEIRAEGAQFFRTQVRLSDEVATIVDAAEHLETPRPVAIPAGLVAPAPAPEPDDDEVSTTDALLATIQRQNAVLKRLFVEIRSLRREVAHVRHSVEDPGEPLVRISSTPAWDARATSDVSVIISLYNYGRFVREAVESALASERVVTEVVVIDDHSTDNGVQVIGDIMRERPDAAIRLLEQRVNTGAQRARNLAFTHARSPYAFVLDADNLVYPKGIGKLRDALDADPAAAFAYGIIERFSADGGLDLMGLEGWDERRLAQSHYIDAMALIRVDAWREVGGYVTDPALELGWEDYDLWLNFASHGYRGVHVREIIGRYRVHGISSLAITSLDTTELRQRLEERHARFFRSVSGDA
jgi:hypothetical protein